MIKKKSKADSEKLSNAVVNGMQEVKASDIVVMDLREVKNAVADFFVICSGGSDKQVNAIADSIDEEVFKKIKENPWHTEGKNNKEWMILDYISVVAHIFRKDRRQFYSLERLWGDAVITEVEDDAPTAVAPVKKRAVKKAPARKK
jgi:ribosome-associated protein